MFQNTSFVEYSSNIISFCFIESWHIRTRYRPLLIIILFDNFSWWKKSLWIFFIWYNISIASFFFKARRNFKKSNYVFLNFRSHLQIYRNFILREKTFKVFSQTDGRYGIDDHLRYSKNDRSRDKSIKFKRKIDSNH